MDLCLGRKDGELQNADLAGFLRDIERVARDYGLSVNVVEISTASFRIASRDLRTFQRLWTSTEPNADSAS